jgi:hypothetical protein
MLFCRMSETGDTPSPLTLTQLLPEPKVDPKEEFLYNTPRSTMQGLKDASSVSAICFFLTYPFK